jgi:hypothetical protein
MNSFCFLHLFFLEYAELPNYAMLKDLERGHEKSSTWFGGESVVIESLTSGSTTRAELPRQTGLPDPSHSVRHVATLITSTLSSFH